MLKTIPKTYPSFFQICTGVKKASGVYPETVVYRRSIESPDNILSELVYECCRWNCYELLLGVHITQTPRLFLLCYQHVHTKHIRLHTKWALHHSNNNRQKYSICYHIQSFQTFETWLGTNVLRLDVEHFRHEDKDRFQIKKQQLQELTWRKLTEPKGVWIGCICGSSVSSMCWIRDSLLSSGLCHETWSPLQNVFSVKK